MKKINLYILTQIFKPCTLVFFIFISIAWLLQISRLFNFLNNLQIEFIEIFYLSLFLIPNLFNIILPFIIIFGLLIAFIKLEKDKEIIAIYSLGLTINAIKKPFIIFSIFIAVLYIFLNLYLSPFIYDIYKKKEFELRNLLNLNNINIANFIEIDKKLILDFDKDENIFVDVFIQYNQENENIIYSKKATILEEESYLIFNLVDGFKLDFIDNKIEKLQFKQYKLKFPLIKNKKYNNIDKNSLTIFNLLESKNNSVIIEKLLDILLVVSIVLLFYNYNIKLHYFSFKKIILFLSITIIALIFHNIIKTIELNNGLELILYLANFIIIFSIIIFSKKIFS